MTQKILISYKVADFKSWKPYFDHVQIAEKDNGLKYICILQNSANLNDLSLLCEVTDAKKANAFLTSNALKEIRKKAGVITKAEVYNLTQN